VAPELEALEFTGEACSISDVERELARLRDAATGSGEMPNLRTSVMTHIAWAPEPWTERAREVLEGMGERHPSRTILLVPEPDAGSDQIDARLSLGCYSVPGVDRQVCSEVIELRLLGRRAAAPASVVQPLLISDLPVFIRWRGRPPVGGPEFRQLIAIVDRLIVDSIEWPDLPDAYGEFAQIFDEVIASDIAWARTMRWRSLLASLWPEIASVQRIRVRGTAAQAYLLAGWLRSRLDKEIELEHDDAERLEGVELDGEPAPFPPGDPPEPSDVLSEELETLTRDRVYEAAVRAAASSS
jgi:hypothetical protein